MAACPHEPMWRIKLSWIGNWVGVAAALLGAGKAAFIDVDPGLTFLFITASLFWLNESSKDKDRWYARRMWEIDRMREGLR